MKGEIDTNILNRYLNGTDTPADYRQVKCWFEDPDYTPQLDGRISIAWQEFEEKQPKKDFGVMLQKIQRQIYLNEKREKRTIWHYYRQIAAIFLLPVLLTTLYFFISDQNHDQVSPWAEIYAPAGARVQFTLPDGSSGWLNSGSSIRYQTAFIDREVKIAGEAYFDVAKKNGQKFKVQTPALTITVLGTRFNVAAYPEDHFTDVVVEEGSVKLDGRLLAFSEILSPAERFLYRSGQKEGKVSQVDASLHSAWTEGKLIFRSEPLSGVLKKMERWYNVRFMVEDSELKEHLYQATFKDETLEEVLKLLSYTAPIDYEVLARQMNADGTYSTPTIKILRKGSN